MTKNIKILLAVLIGVPLLVYLGYQYNVDRVRQIANQYEVFGAYSGQKEIDNYNQENNFLAVTWKLTSSAIQDEAFSELKDKTSRLRWDSIVGKKYLIRQNIQLRYSGASAIRHARNSDEYWNLTIYNLEDLNSSPRVVDILSRFETKQNIVRFVFETVYLNEKGEEILVLNSFTEDKEVYFQLFNLETEEVEVYIPDNEYSIDIEDHTSYPGFHIGLSTDTVDSLAANGIRDGSWGFMLYPNTQREPNAFFRSFFPDIKGELTEDHQIFIRAETPLELLEAYEKFFKDPTELYRGLTLSSDYAVDGQEHVVQTKEEFLTFYRDPDKGGN